MDNVIYKVIRMSQAWELGDKINTLNREESQKEEETINRGTEPTVYRWEPCGAIGYINGGWFMPIVKKRCTNQYYYGR